MTSFIRYNNGYNSGDTYITGIGWIGTADTNGPVLNVGEGIFYQNADATVNLAAELHHPMI